MFLLNLVRTHAQKNSLRTKYLRFITKISKISVKYYFNVQQKRNSMITTLKFSDGLELKLTDGQIEELKIYFNVKKAAKNKRDLDFYKSRVLAYVKKGVSTKAGIINRLRRHEVIVCEAIEQLINDGVLRSVETEHKYSKFKSIELFIV